MTSAQKQLHNIIDNDTTCKEEDIFKLFDQLEPVTIEEVIGQWSGAAVETGHMTSGWCRDVNFAGKTFHAKDNVEPVFVFNEKGERVFYEPAGRARARRLNGFKLREVKYRGVVTACLIYNGAPTMDYFRKIDDDTLLSAADNINKPTETMGTFFFYLKRDK